MTPRESGNWSYDHTPDRRQSGVRFAAYPARMVVVEYGGMEYTLPDDQAVLLAQNLRNYAKGTLPEDVERAASLSGNRNWTDGALAAADFIEEALVGNLQGPLPLEGKAAEATFWALRLMQDLLGSAGPRDMAALRDALGQQFQRAPA